MWKRTTNSTECAVWPPYSTKLRLPNMTVCNHLTKFQIKMSLSQSTRRRYQHLQTYSRHKKWKSCLCMKFGYMITTSTSSSSMFKILMLISFTEIYTVIRLTAKHDRSSENSHTRTYAPIHDNRLHHATAGLFPSIHMQSNNTTPDSFEITRCLCVLCIVYKQFIWKTKHICWSAYQVVVHSDRGSLSSDGSKRKYTKERKYYLISFQKLIKKILIGNIKQVSFGIFEKKKIIIQYDLGVIEVNWFGPVIYLKKKKERKHPILFQWVRKEEKQKFKTISKETS